MGMDVALTEAAAYDMLRLKLTPASVSWKPELLAICTGSLWVFACRSGNAWAHSMQQRSDGQATEARGRLRPTLAPGFLPALRRWSI